MSRNTLKSLLPKIKYLINELVWFVVIDGSLVKDTGGRGHAWQRIYLDEDHFRTRVFKNTHKGVDPAIPRHAQHTGCAPKLVLHLVAYLLAVALIFCVAGRGDV